MYPVSQTFKDWVSAQTRDVYAKIVIEAVDEDGLHPQTITLLGGDIIDFSVDYPFDDGSRAVFGMALSATASFHIKNPNLASYFSTGTVTLKPYVGFPDAMDQYGNVTSVEYMPMGVFKTYEVSSTDNYNTINITAYDAIFATDVPFPWQPSTPILWTDISVVTNMICSAFGLQLDPGVVFPVDSYGNEIEVRPFMDENGGYVTKTAREWLGWIASFFGGNALIDRNGYLTFKGYERHTDVVVGTEMQLLGGVKRYREEGISYAGLYLTLDDGSHLGTPPEVYRTKVFGNVPKRFYEIPLYVTYFNDLNKDITQNVFHYVPIQYPIKTHVPAEIQYRGIPYLDPGDLILVDMDGVNMGFIIAHHTIKVGGGMSGMIRCYGVTSQEDEATASYGNSFANSVSAALDEKNTIGSVVITSTNTPPNARGTWTLIDKEFTPTTATQISVGTGSSNDFVLNSTNTTSMSAWVSRHGHSITLSVNAITFKVSVTGTNLTLGTFNLANLGASEATVSPIIIGWSDGAHAIVGMTINRTSGVMQSQDVVVRGTGTSIAAGSSAVFTVELPCDYQYMTDSLCNKFYWKRTA